MVPANFIGEIGHHHDENTKGDQYPKSERGSDSKLVSIWMCVLRWRARGSAPTARLSPAYPRQCLPQRRLSAVDLSLFDTGGKDSAMIQVRLTAERDPFIFDVVVSEGKAETRHHVTMSREMCERLTAGKHTPERCLEAAFLFLLDREPKESILRRFDVTEISRYFPEFEREMPRYLSQL
jgi:hypothetical protein